MISKHLLEENYNHEECEGLTAVVMKVVLFKIIISSRDSEVAHILYIMVLKIWETVCNFELQVRRNSSQECKRVREVRRKYISTPTCENGVIFCVPRLDSFSARMIRKVSKINVTVRELLKSIAT
jgi:hypothetical protein